ncbi:MAG: GTPase ObgE [Oscillospiraceae bacterium]|nr:GTPase ObgE [Oscillospiraceae bacterium]MBQ3500036.1 GTPase ObgE [Oscillospiraceae bacterium]MBQ4545560.1 GTPase ObgE [Oscillospiraceae bacterium]MBQ4644067.1 GTPase ObgE [Oscillospiraceae bacterium]
MFVDTAKIRIKAGDGGNGACTFHREKYVNAGGPDGGDGGRGGNVVFVGDTNINSLIDFKYKKRYFAENGKNGSGSNMTGKSAPDLVIKVPVGTLIREAETGRVLADISDKEPHIVAKGGKGGWGNQHFASPTRQIPKFAKPGFPGEEFEVTLELKLLADVGLVGFPNVGKSTLISVVSAAKPEIANYPFTTLTPVLGVVKMDAGNSFVMADIPGLIEGASEGIGLGHDFLRHVERCRLILHVVDISAADGRDPIDDYKQINYELEKFNPELAKRPQIVALNKADASIEEMIDEFNEFAEENGFKTFLISAATGEGVRELVNAVAAELAKLPPIVRYEVEAPTREEITEKQEFKIHIEDGIYVVEAPWLMHALGYVDLDDYESLQYFQRVLRLSGIIDKLEEMGINEGDTVSILDIEFDYMR